MMTRRKGPTAWLRRASAALCLTASLVLAVGFVSARLVQGQIRSEMNRIDGVVATEFNVDDPGWSEGGTRYNADVVLSGGRRLTIFDIERGDFDTPRWSIDVIGVGESRSGQLERWRVPAAGGETTQTIGRFPLPEPA